MSFSIIAAISSNNIISKKNKLPWNIPEDLQHFYNLIRGKTIVMGRKTYDSIGGTINDSQNIVLSRNDSLQLSGCKVLHSISEVLDLYKEFDEEIMIIGGADIYQQFLPFVNRMYLTFIHKDFEGDISFPKWIPKEWGISDECDSKNSSCSYSFVTLQKKPG